MFSRGAGNLEEVPMEYVSRCIVNNEDAGSAEATSILRLFSKALGLATQADIGWGFLVPKDWCRAMTSCKSARAALHDKPEWLGILGYRLIKKPQGFSPSILTGILLQNPEFSGAAWRTKLLTDRVRERVLDGATYVNLVALSSAEDSEAFWTGRLKGLLSLPNMPTGPQAEEATKTVGILVDKDTGMGVSAVMEASLSIEKPNSTVGPVILKAVIDVTPRQRPAVVKKDDQGSEKIVAVEEGPKAMEYLDAEAIGALLAKCGVTSIRTLVMLMGGVRVEDLKADVKTLPYLKNIRIPRSVRRAMVKALAKSSWFALLGVFRFKMFFMGLFKSIHIVDVLSNKDGDVKTAPDQAKVFLLQALLRAECYPKTQAAYDALATAGKPWDKLVAAPLSRIAEDPLFSIDEEWTVTGFQERLEGKKIPRPTSTSVVSMLCAHGNRRVTWHAIMDCGQITSAQILQNVVSLVMMDFPVERVQSQLLKSMDRISMTDLMKAYTVLKATFSPSEIAALREAAREPASTTNEVAQDWSDELEVPQDWSDELFVPVYRKKKRGKRTSFQYSTDAPHVHAEPATKKRREGELVEGVEGMDEGEDTDAIEVRVTREYGVADKKGQRHQIDRQRTVSTGFGRESVDNYMSMLTSALSNKMDELAEGGISNHRAKLSADGNGGPCKEGNTAGEAGGVVGVISYTEELSKNVVRSGVPPPLPEYTKVAMWRGEDVCLNQLGAGGMNELLVGITWCEPKGSCDRVDLDLSVMVYDAEWHHLAYCSYDTPDLRIPGVQHSGDRISAPYPDGARETCRIDVASLLEGFPKARYIVLAVYSYSRQQWDTLEDASVFVANPQARGSGPGGMAVIGAARLTGAATTSIAGYLDIAPYPLADIAQEAPDTPALGANTASQVVASTPRGDVKRTYKDRRIHFVFTDQEGRLGHIGNSAHASTYQVGQMLAKMQESRAKAGPQSLVNAASFQAALVCSKVLILSEGVAGKGIDKIASQVVVRGDTEGRFEFYERIATVLQGALPAAPAAGRKGVSNYSLEALLRTGGTNSRTVFFGGDLDDWLEITREHDTYRNKTDGEKRVRVDESTLILVNLRSADKGWAKDGESGVISVNGATAYDALCEAMREVSLQ